MASAAPEKDAPVVEGEKEKGIGAEDLLCDELAREMARFGIREWREEAAETRREEDAAATEEADRLIPAFHAYRNRHRYSYLLEPTLPGGTMREVGWVPPLSSSPGMPRDRALLDEWRFPGDRLGRGRGHAFGPQNQQGAGSIPPRAAGPGVLPSDAYVAPPPAWPWWRAEAVNRQVGDLTAQLSRNQETVFHTLFMGTPEASDAVVKEIVFYARDLMESSHGQRLLGLVLDNCDHVIRDSIVAGITRDKTWFSRICAERSDEVVRMIRSCRSWKSFQLLREAIIPWMAPSMMQSLLMDSNRLRVVQALVQCFPPHIAQFIFDAVAKNCITIACHPNGLCLLQNCLEHVNLMEKDNIFTEVSHWSVHLAQNPYGNYIVQDVLKQRDPSHLQIIATCFRHRYVELSRQKYSSNVVETCLKIFDVVEQFAIINELIWYPHFRDLVTDEYANYVISTALLTCMVPLQQILATAILSLENVNRRHPHCLKIFDILSKLGCIFEQF